MGKLRKKVEAISNSRSFHSPNNQMYLYAHF